jgi:pimeloyl-ACP methyl ester carboxylesterase
MRRAVWVVLIIAVLVGVAHALWPKAPDRGNGAFFADRTYDFEAKRVLNDVAAAGGDTNEALHAIRHVTAGDEEGWYRAWKEAGDRAHALASRTHSNPEKGNALLRAHTYYRSAEFFLPAHDARRPGIWRSNVDAFYQGLDALGVRYERIQVPYGSHHLNALYYPGATGSQAKPLLVFVNGYDGTMEELYLSGVAAALAHGYAVLTYEGPGQGSVIREQQLTFDYQWEKPNGAVLDTFLANHPKPVRIVLIGESLGGYLAPRAAAFDPRIDGVVAFDVWYDGYGIATRHVARAAFWLRDHHYDSVLRLLAARTSDPGARWATENGQWVFGVEGPFAVLDAFKDYDLSKVAARITGDVLLLAGSDDHFVPPEQLEQMRKALVHARSVKAVMFDRASGGALHCQIGAPSLWQGTLFDWLELTYPSETAAARP